MNNQDHPSKPIILALILHQQNLKDKLANVKKEKIDFTNIRSNNMYKENLERQIISLEQQIQALIND